MSSPIVRPDISVVILAKNEEAKIGRCLERLASQRAPYRLETLLIDSGSTDRTIAIARERGATVVEIPPASFNYGTTRNEALRWVHGERVLFLTAHAYAADNTWLAELGRPLDLDPKTAAAFSREIPDDACPDLERRALEPIFPEGAYLQDLAGRSLEEFLAERRWVTFSNVSSIVRTEVLAAIPFRALPGAEDQEWAVRVLAAGHRIAYAAASRIVHYNDDPLPAMIRRTYRNWRVYAPLYHRRLGLGDLARSIPSSIAGEFAFARRRARRPVPHFLRSCVWWPAFWVAAYAGSRNPAWT
ncbi:MAG: glycosyltransferase family 2 protein [Planctomycetes bacterium]|nr:glycosyltransferase family 2 protein [Planctomycetota bacterium]